MQAGMRIYDTAVCTMVRIQRQCNGNQIWRKHGIGKKDYGIEGQAGSAAALAAIYVKKKFVCAFMRHMLYCSSYNVRDY